jgi:hypothetical protein
MPRKYVQKVLTVDAVQYQGLTQNLRAFMQGDLFVNDMGVNIVCVGGLTQPLKGDWIVRDVNGVVSVLAPNIFKERYAEIVDERQDS